MSDAEAAEAPSQPAHAPPLNLPVGSVRALLTLLVLGSVWVQLLRGQPTSEELRDTMLLVLGYYFGSRSRRAPAEALTVPGDREENPTDPLYLPRGMIRLLIVVGFGAVAYQLHRAGRLLTSPPPLLILVGTFLLGATVKGSALWVGSHLTTGLRNAAGHLVAAATLLVVLAFCGAELTELHPAAPPWLTPAFLSVVGFYLGKR